MRKVPLVAVIWTMALAIPFTALALSAVAYLTDHLIGIATSLVSFSQATTQIGRPWLLEIGERMPEVAGMVVGQLIILIILFLVRPTEAKEQSKKQ
jgi:hypothetical protein